MFHNKQALIGIYSNSISTGSQLYNFSVTTTSGNIQVNWGDGTSDTINSEVPINHTFNCIGYSIPGGFWYNIDPCI